MLISLVIYTNTAIASFGASAPAAPFPKHAIDEWVWVDIDESICMSGKATGVYVKFGSGTGVGIYLNGGGACFNAETCLAVAQDAHPGTPGKGGIFSATDDRNPFKGYSWVNVPYCSGDVHTGAITHVFDLAKRHFQGRNNLALISARAKATWPSPSHLVITGESAGGFGSAANYDFLRGVWSDVPNLKGLLMDDSGPILDDAAIAPCLQEGWRNAWNLNASLPPDCPCVSNGGNLVSIWNYTQSKWPNDKLCLISTLKDAVISVFFAYGQLDCLDPLPIGYTKLEAGLKSLAASGVSSYLIKGTEHTHTGSKSEFFTKTSEGVNLAQWISELISGANPPSVIPK